MSGARYALYYAPPRGSELHRFGSAWLGRDAETGDRVGPPALHWIDADRQRAITEEPRRYGFHGTLKPPFALAQRRTVDELGAAVAAFACGRNAFSAPPLTLTAVGSFLALVPSAPSAELDRLAATAVRDLDLFRAPPSPEELARRRAAGLSMRQEGNLLAWGYPHVMEDFRFHLTLTGKLEQDERQRVRQGLEPLVAPLCRDPLPVADVCLFVQDEGEAPFTIRGRYPLGAAKR